MILSVCTSRKTKSVPKTIACHFCCRSFPPWQVWWDYGGSERIRWRNVLFFPWRKPPTAEITGPQEEFPGPPMTCVYVNRTAGSPFSTWASSASLLKVAGPGIEHGVLSTFKSVFEVDATEAGPGDLKVRVGGRRGQSWVKLTAMGHLYAHDVN